MTTPNLLSIQRTTLTQLARKPDHPLFGARNHELDDYIQQLKQERPEAFHTDASLDARIFVHAPKQDAVRGRLPHKYSARQSLSPTELAERASVIGAQIIKKQGAEHANTLANN